MRILFLSRWCPAPADNGSKLRIYNLLRILAARHEVTLVSFRDSSEIPDSGLLARIGVTDCHFVEYRAYNPISLRSLVGFLGSKPRSISDTWSDAMAELIRGQVRRVRFDAVVASQVWMAAYHDCFAGVPAVFEESELGLFRQSLENGASPIDKARCWLTWTKHSRYMRELVSEFACCSTVSPLERDLLVKVAPACRKVAVIPNGIDLAAYDGVIPAAEPATLIFAGSLTYHPNYDAMKWFLAGIYPLIRRDVPGVNLKITGHGADLPLPEQPLVVRTGMVPDVRTLVASASVSIAPIRSGGGTRLKILEAMGLGTPVVATSKAAEGLDVENGVHLLIADTEADFASAVARLLTRESLRQRLAAAARELVRLRYDWQVLAPTVLQLVADAARTRQP
jgi:glycosyltransferase involved in cell wall biosynthesis